MCHSKKLASPAQRMDSAYRKIFSEFKFYQCDVYVYGGYLHLISEEAWKEKAANNLLQMCESQGKKGMMERTFSKV